jgi:phage terminase small subunit
MKKGDTKTTKNIENITSIDELDEKYLEFLEELIKTNNVTQASKLAGFCKRTGIRLKQKMSLNVTIQDYINKKRQRYIKKEIKKEIKFSESEIFNRLQEMMSGELQEEREVIVDGQIHKVKNSSIFKAIKLIVDKQKMFDEGFIHDKKIQLEKLRIERLRLARDLKNDKLKQQDREDSYY